MRRFENLNALLSIGAEVVLTDAFLDKFLRDAIADGTAFTPGWLDVIAQAQDANRFHRALLTIAELGRREDAKVATGCLQEANRDGH